jgi:hypothetical protein
VTEGQHRADVMLRGRFFPLPKVKFIASCIIGPWLKSVSFAVALLRKSSSELFEIV